MIPGRLVGEWKAVFSKGKIVLTRPRVGLPLCFGFSTQMGRFGVGFGDKPVIGFLAGREVCPGLQWRAERQQSYSGARLRDWELDGCFRFGHVWT